MSVGLNSACLNDAGPDLLAALVAALGLEAVRPPEPRYLTEPRGRLHGRAAAVVRPASTEQVARAVGLCAAARVGVVPYGGGTGLVGGQIATEGPLPVLLSLERLRHIRAVDPSSDVLVTEAGAVLAEVQAAAAAAGRLFPLALASQGSAQIGGLLATNAGGTAVLRYGNARDLCLGIEAVLADGRVLNLLSELRKDNTGYDLRNLLIGSEGTLGVITAASLRLFPRPEETATAWVAVPSPAAALDLLHRLQDRLGGTLSAFELMGARGLEFLAEVMPEVPRPLANPPAWSVLVEAGDGAGAGLGPRLEAALAAALEVGLIEDALVAQSQAQAQAFWTVRETIPEANRKIGAVGSHDIALPLGRVPEFIARGDAAIAALDPDLRVNCFGHLGDGNLHYNVFPPRGRHRAEFEALRAPIRETVHGLALALGGTFSAEHGIGRLKTAELARWADPTKLALMQAIKATLDPVGILNPGAVLPAIERA